MFDSPPGRMKHPCKLHMRYLFCAFRHLDFAGKKVKNEIVLSCKSGINFFLNKLDIK